MSVKLALDTNAYKLLHDGNEILAGKVRTAEAIGLPIIVVGELRFGFLNGSRLTENAFALERFASTDRVHILPLTERTTHLFAEIATLLRRQGTPIQQNDIWIAALCKEHEFALATRDRGFHNVLGLPIVDF